MIRRLARDMHGTTVVEFAFIMPVMAVLLIGGLELGYRAYLSAVLQGALLEAARQASIGDKSEAQVNALVRYRISPLIDASNNPEFVKEPYFNFSNVDKAEKITSDTAPIGIYNATDCFEDVNNNGLYDTTRRTGLGTADDIVRYKVTVTYPNILPVNRLLGWGDTQTVVASTVMRNQPFTSRAQPTIRCP